MHTEVVTIKQKKDNLNSVTSNQSTRKLMQLLETMSAEKSAIRLVDLAKKCSMGSSTTLRYLITLEDLGYITKSVINNKYSLTSKILYLGNQSLIKSDIEDTLTPFLQRASTSFQAQAAIYTNENNRLTRKLFCDITHPELSYPSANIDIFPMHCSASGKLFLQQYSTYELHEYILQHGLPRFTEHTITTFAALKTELDKVKRNGYAISRDEHTSGISCVAAPILDKSGKLVATLGINNATSRLTDEYIFDNILNLISICSDISRLRPDIDKLLSKDDR